MALIKKITLFLFLFLPSIICAQEETVGLLFYSENAAPGYTLYSPNSSRDAFLIDNCGYQINKWENTSFPEIMSYLLEDGSLLRMSPGFIEKRSWDDEWLWIFSLEDFGFNHHDIEPMPNGNVLAIVTEYMSAEEAIARGRDPELVEDDVFGVDAIYEIKQTGFNTGEIVWRWSFWDHLVQDVDANKPNFGAVSENPRRLNVNYNDLGDSYDWLHCNSVEYNAELDQIILSSRHTSELYIIDHSTTTEEAMGSTGGNSGFGGDFLWRWGNKKAYDKGDFDDQQLYQQHNPLWVPDGYPDAGKITVFNNLANFDFDGQEEFSEIHILDTEVNSDGSYDLNSDGTFGPADFFWTYTGEVLGNNFWSEIESGVQMQPNGNMLACMAVGGRFVEVTRTGEVVWVYQNPVSFEPVNQGFNVNEGFFDVFRAERYGPDYPAFEGRDLSRQGVVESFNTISEACALVLAVEDIGQDKVKLFPNPASDVVYIAIEGNQDAVQVQLFSPLGQLMAGQLATSWNGNEMKIKLDKIPAGFYILKVTLKDQEQSFRLVVH